MNFNVFLHFIFFCRFAYVQFNDAANVKEAIDNHQGIDYDGRPLYLDYSSGGPQKRGPRNSYGGGELCCLFFVCFTP